MKARLFLIGLFTCIAHVLSAQYSGGNGDGFSTSGNCVVDLTGNSLFAIGSISGPATFCRLASEAYTINPTGLTAATTFTWSVPAGAVITSGQGTRTILVTFGNSDGIISVDVSNECQTLTASLSVSSAACTFYSGGTNDGYASSESCATNLTGGSVLSISSITGSSTFCSFGTESYSVDITGIESVTYTWSVPAGASITSGQGTNKILVTFGNTPGTVSVELGTECEISTLTLPVTLTSCNFYYGGANDGFSASGSCATNLTGGSVFSLSPISGSSTFCSFGTEGYSIVVGGATPTTTYTWSVPAGATITSGQGTNTILVTFGNSSGIVSVDVANECESLNITLPVSLTSCLFYSGGSGDGFSVSSAINVALPIELVSFKAVVEERTVHLIWTTESEVENDFFEVEKSKNGKTFSVLTKIKGAGTVNKSQTYLATDTVPFLGLSYYRLSQTDFNGKKSYSKIIAVEIDNTSANHIALYPNPIYNGDVLHFDYYAGVGGTIKISIIGASGKLISTMETKIKPGLNELSFKPDFKERGVYILYIETGTERKAFRIMVL